MLIHVILPHRCPGSERISPQDSMDILAALKQEEAKWEKEVSAASNSWTPCEPQ
jgi:hypothetical protein